MSKVLFLERPIFIVGCCNSGTTILWQALRRHAALDGPTTEGQELVGLPRSMTHFLGKQTSRMFAHPKFGMAYRLTGADYDSDTAARLVATYSRCCRRGQRLIEKSPANTLRIRFLQRVFPDASFVGIVRNGIAVAEGIVRKRRWDPDRPHLAGLPTTLTEAAEQWAHANMVLLQDLAGLPNAMVIRYEELVSEPISTLRRVLMHCGLDLSAFPIPKFETELDEAQSNRLGVENRARVRRACGGVLERLGY
jgi:hypothetical protein